MASVAVPRVYSWLLLYRQDGYDGPPGVAVPRVEPADEHLLPDLPPPLRLQVQEGPERREKGKAGDPCH